MGTEKDWTRDLESVRRQNIKLLAEREAYRDTVRALRRREANYQLRLRELWGICTDVHSEVSRALQDSNERNNNWSNVVAEVRKLSTAFLLQKAYIEKAVPKPSFIGRVWSWLTRKEL